MSKRKRKSFPESEPVEKRISQKRAQELFAKETIHEGERIGGIYGFFRDYGVRETIESILIAVVLALMFRAFEAEAFIIPTGSMAPTLQGQHMDVTCEKCSYQYRAGASLENSTHAPQDRDLVDFTVCPICQYQMRMSRNSNPEHHSYNGDRILVNKFVYDFVPPRRFDVIVFKNPNNGKQNYIKRLIGLPNENIIVDSGDIYLVDPDGKGGWTNKRIVSKPPRKLEVMLQEVDDTHYLAPELVTVGWPLRWQQWTGGNNWQSAYVGDSRPLYSAKSGDTIDWLRYRHLVPRRSDWESIEVNTLPRHIREDQLGNIISDYYCYNDREYRSRRMLQSPIGAHWVGDIALEAWVRVKSDTGTLLFDLVEGGAHFQCAIDISTGNAVLSSDDSSVQFKTEANQAVGQPQATTSLRGAGTYQIKYANADNRIYLWIDKRVVAFDAPFYDRSSEVIPKWTPTNSLDAEPAGVGLQNAEAEVSRLKILRDVYYTSVNDKEDIHNETMMPMGTIRRIHENPELWETNEGKRLFRAGKNKSDAMYPLEDGQYLPMGDNSPASLDGRVWRGPKYVPEENMIGRAMFIFWPHSLRTPVPFFPNFKRMGFIR